MGRQNHCVHTCATSGTQLSGSRVNKGFPLYDISHRTTSWADKTTAYTHVTRVEHNCQGPVLIRVSLYMIHHIEPLRGQTITLRTHNTHNHCVTQLEHNCQGPVLIRVFSYMKHHIEPTVLYTVDQFVISVGGILTWG